MMIEHSLLRDVGIAILGAGAFGLAAHLLRMPLLLGQLIAGMVLGPQMGLDLIKDAQNMATLSDIGLILLMFILGIEIDLRKIKLVGKPVVFNGLSQFLGCFLMAILFFGLLKLEIMEGPYALLYVAMACSLSSTLIVVKILSDQMELDTLTSRITLGILVLQDLWAITFMAMQPNLSHFSFFLVLLSISKAILLVGVSWAVAKYVLPHLFKKAGKRPELLLVIAMAWCFLACGLAHYLSLSKEMGALVAGITIASFPYHIELSAKISSLRDFFITLFFVALGMQIPQPTVPLLLFTLCIVLFALFSRVITIFPILYGLRYGNRASFIPGINLGQISEFSLVLLTIGIGYNHVGNKVLSAFILALVITAIFSSILIPHSHALFRIISPLLEGIGFKDRFDGGREEEKKSSVGHPLVILGFYREASSLLHQLQKRHSANVLQDILVIDFNPESLERLKRLGVPYKYGDISNLDTLSQFHLDKAQLIISTIPDHFLRGTTNLKILKAIKIIAPQANVVTTAETFAAARDMYKEGADYVFLPRLVTAHFLADVIERIQSGNMKILNENAKKHLEGLAESLP